MDQTKYKTDIPDNDQFHNKIDFGIPNEPSRTKPGQPRACNVSSNSLLLTWEKPEDKEVEYYTVKYKASNGQTWSRPIFTEDDKTFFNMKGLVEETGYTFKVKPHYNDNEGEFSDESDLIKTLCLDLPAPKCILKPGKPFAVDLGISHIAIEWEKPRDKCVEYYEIKWKKLADKTWIRQSAFTDDNQPYKCIKGLSPATEYEFKVRSYYEDEESDFSDKSDPVMTKELPLVEFKSREPGQNETIPKDSICPENPLSSIESPPVTEKVMELSPSKMSSTKPGKPTPSKIESDSIDLYWEKPTAEGVEYYEIKMKEGKDARWSKTSINTNDENPCHQIKGLLPNTQYIFKVKAQFQEDGGEFSESSDPIFSKKSPALSALALSYKLQDGNPAIYKLPIHEQKGTRNERFRTRKCEFGSSNMSFHQEKTIMIVGATGSGKSTLIDGLVNYLLGVNWEDDFRFKIIDITSEEEERQGKQTESQTDWITSYRLHPIGHTCKFILNIIDTPGFGDTRGIQRDNKVVEQIRHFFTTKDATGIRTLEAVCFVTQAPLVRLTAVQKYIFDAILSIFGKDMAENIVAMVTFADGKQPPVLNALSAAKVPVSHTFIFNNSALFEPNKKDVANQFAKMFWEMGYKSFDNFLAHLPRMETRSLQMTSQVLSMREQLQVTVEGLMPQIDEGLLNLNTMRKEKRLVEKYESEIRDNKNFTYETTEHHQHKRNLNPGVYVTNCTFCNRTCHYPCGIPNDEHKINCWAMTNGYCRICPEKCKWDQHRNNDFRIEIEPVKVMKTYAEMKSKYDLAGKKAVTQQTLVQSIKVKFIKVKDTVMNALQKVRECGNFLRENAIRSDPLSEIEYIDLLMQSEKDEKRPGFLERMNMLKVLRRNAELKAKSLSVENIDTILEQLGFDDE